MRTTGRRLLVAAVILAGLMIPALATADENPIEGTEYSHLSGQLAQLLGQRRRSGRRVSSQEHVLGEWRSDREHRPQL